jgi:hypothetical protein
MRINLNFAPSLEECPDCGNEQEFGPGNAVCRACNYHAGSELSQEWIDEVTKMEYTLPQGVDMEFAHEAESLTDYYIDVRFAWCEAETFTTWLAKFSKQFSVESCELQNGDDIDAHGPTAFWTPEARHDAGVFEGETYSLFGNGGAEEDYVMSGTPEEIAEYFQRENDYDRVDYTAVPEKFERLYRFVVAGQRNALTA